jgi:hypothetical protein
MISMTNDKLILSEKNDWVDIVVVIDKETQVPKIARFDRNGKTPREKAREKMNAFREAKQKAQGAAQLVKAELGLDKAPEELVQERKAICLACENYDFGVCVKKCRCYLAAKVKLKNEKCPVGKW